VLGLGFLLSGMAALFFTAVALGLRSTLLTLSGATGGISPLAIPYFTLTAAGSILMFLMMMCSITFNAQGDNFTSTKFFAVSTFINALLDPLFIFGWGVFPALGIEGAAYATLLSQVVYLVLALRILSGPKMMVRLRPSNLRLRWNSVKKVATIGFPASLNQVLNPIGFSALMAVVSATFFEAGAAAFSIGFRIEFFAFIPAVGFGFGVMAMMGQNLGAGNLDRVRQAFKTATTLGAGSALVISLLAFFLAHLIVGAFTDDAVVTDYAIGYFHIVPLGYVFFSLAFIEANVFQGLGRSWPGFWITFARVSLAFTLALVSVRLFSLPLEAVWIAIAASSVVVSMAGFAWVLRALRQMKARDGASGFPAEAEEILTAPIG
jgi:putative MATE family efflux protein